MGGLGIVVFSIALIPSYEMKNTSIFSAEVPGVEVDKLRPKIASTARRLLLIYLALSLVCTIAYWAGPMNLFDAVCHSMTTIATGGFSTHTQSIAYYHSTYLEYISPLFMVLSGVNFSLYYYMTIRRPQALFRNEEFRTFLSIVGIMVVFFVLLFYFAPVPPENLASLPQGFEERIRSAWFHVASVITSTGYSAQKFDYVAWGSAFWMPTVLIMGIGSCAGSTAGGVKIIRLLIAVFCLCLGTGLVAYLISALVIPSRPAEEPYVRMTGAPKKLRRSATDKTVCGVCGGVAEYFGIDSVIVRLLLVFFCLLGGSGVIAYIIAAIIIPEADHA
jgi:trk system potassium uptake protein TrkH